MSCSFASSETIFFNLDRPLSLPTARWVQMSGTWSENVRLLSNIRPRVLTLSQNSALAVESDTRHWRARARVG